MTSVIRLFRLDVASWDRVSHIGTMASAAATAIGAFAFFAFDRLGFQAFVAPRASARMLLVGFYGWVGLTAIAWLIAKRVGGGEVGFAEAFRIYGYAHLPLLLLGFVIQMVAVVVQVLGPSLVFAQLVVLLWMPASLVAATRYIFGVGVGRAALIILGPYVLWLATVGTYLWQQVGHLL